MDGGLYVFLAVILLVFCLSGRSGGKHTTIADLAFLAVTCAIIFAHRSQYFSYYPILNPDEALFAASQLHTIELHFNKGLAGAPAEAVAAATDTAMNPDVLNAFALAIIADGGAPAYPGLATSRPDAATGRTKAREVVQAMNELLKLAPRAGSYVSESNYF